MTEPVREPGQLNAKSSCLLPRHLCLPIKLKGHTPNSSKNAKNEHKQEIHATYMRMITNKLSDDHKDPI